jgi:peptidoglycan/LPS O-acetylase OafA/YrhL
VLLNNPSWSLFDELIANCFHALVLRRRSTSFLVVSLCVCGACFLFLTITYRTAALGVARGQVLSGVPRVLFSYLLGCLLQRIQQYPGVARCGAFFYPAVFVFIATTFIPVRQDNDLIVPALISTLLPVLLLTGANHHPQGFHQRVARYIGNASYAVYVIHAPLGLLYASLWLRLTHRILPASVPYGGLSYLLLVGLAAHLLVEFYDVPVRAWISGKRFNTTDKHRIGLQSRTGRQPDAVL